MKDTLNARFRAPLKEHYRRRIIVWKDEEGEFANAVAELELENARILVMQRDRTFELRRQIEVDYAQENLLIYCPLTFAKPQDNWLLEVFLYSEEFRADYWSLLFQELNIADTPDARDYARSVADFFGSKERREKLRALREHYDTGAELEIGILGVLCGAREYGFGEIVRRVLCCDPGEENPCLSAMAKVCGEDAFWQLCEQNFGYAGAHDCDRLTCHILTTAALDGMETAALSGLPCDAAHATQAYGFFENWLRRDREGLVGVCYWVEERFGVEACLRRMDREALLRMRVFPAADAILLDAALNSFAQGRLNLDEAEELLRARRDQAWAEEYAAYYRALRALTDMQRFHLAHRGAYHATALKELWTAYADELYRMDQCYRTFCVACDQALELMQMALEDSLKAAAETADRMYKNSYLGELNALWTRLVSEQGLDALTGVARQADFYREKVAPSENRVYVVISDGLRYEVAKTLEERLSGSLRGNTTCGAMLGALPGITPVGMSALLPHARLTMEDDLKIRCDGMATDAPNRERVLRSACPESIAVDSVGFRRCSREQRAELVRGKKVVYIYHDAIDRVGESGGDVAQACEAAVRELMQLMNLLVNERKAGTVLITSDQCVIMNTISALMHCGMVGLLKTYLLARPPIEGFLSAMIAFAVQKGADWTAELLEAYRRGDMDFIRTYPETDIAPMELKLQMPERPEDLAENYAPTVLRAAERLKHMVDLEMRWTEREGLTDAKRIETCVRTAMADAEFEGKNVEKALAPLNTLAEQLSDREISDIQGKHFVLLGFGNATKKRSLVRNSLRWAVNCRMLRMKRRITWQSTFLRLPRLRRRSRRR